MTTGAYSVVYPVTDLDAAKTLYGALLGEPHTDMPYYVGYNVNGFEIGLAPGANQGVGGPVTYWRVPDVAAAVAELDAAGASVLRDTGDVGGGTVLAIVADPEGNPIGLIQA